MSTLNIEELQVDDGIKQEFKQLNIDKVTALQQKIITNLTAGRSLIVKSNPKETPQTIAVSALGTSLKQADEEGTICLILASSPKNVKAIGKQINELGTADLTCATMDEQMEPQQKKAVLDKEPDILIATPGTLQQTMRKMRHVFRHVHYIILDEFDDMNTKEQQYCLKQLRLRTLSDYTSLIFASTLEDDVKEMAARFAEESATIGFKSSSAAPPVLPSSLKQNYINVPPRMKISILMALVQQSKAKKTVIFTASKRGADRLYKILKKENLQASSIHGRLSEGKRTQRFKRFTNGNAAYLLVADISAGELELDNIEQVINYDVPGDTKEYRFRAAIVHPNEADGIVSLVSGQDKNDIQALQKTLKTKLTEQDLPADVRKKAKNRKKKSKKKRQKKSEMELPRPSYEKLSGGRNGNHDEEETGIVQLFKKLFTS